MKASTDNEIKHLCSNAPLQKGQALVLVGEQGCGKSTMARAIASQRGSFLEVDSSIFADVFALGSVLAREVSTLIVEEIPRDTQFLLRIKAILTNETVLCHEKGQIEKYVKSPNLIFCTGDISPINDLGYYDRRFCVVHMGVDLACASEATEKPLTDPVDPEQAVLQGKLSLKKIINKPLCWWFGCRPNYPAHPCSDDCHSHTCICTEDYDDEPPCKRCGNDFKSFEDEQWEGTRHEHFVSFFHYWFFRKWWPEKCKYCGVRFGECIDDCVGRLPF